MMLLLQKLPVEIGLNQSFSSILELVDNFDEPSKHEQTSELNAAEWR